MKNVLRLEVEWLDTKAKKLSKDEENSLRKKLFQKSSKEFRAGTKDLLDSNKLKIIQELPTSNEIVVEYDENDKKIRERFLKLDIVGIIDLYADPISSDPALHVLTAKEQMMQELERKMQEMAMRNKK